MCVDAHAQLDMRPASLPQLAARAHMRFTRTGNECSRILVALALLQPTGARECYVALAIRLLQLIDTLSPQQLCDVRTLSMHDMCGGCGCGRGGGDVSGAACACVWAGLVAEFYTWLFVGAVGAGGARGFNAVHIKAGHGGLRGWGRGRCR